ELDALRAADDSGSDLARVTRAAEALARDIRCRAVAVTMGSRGALLVRAGDLPLAIPARPSSAADTVGAGDCFAATVSDRLALGDGLIVLLNSDASVRRLKGPDRPRQSQADREAVLRALACVDAVQIFDTDTPVPALEDLRPDVFAKGGDYTASGLAEAELLT